jgi:carbamoyltransferase
VITLGFSCSHDSGVALLNDEKIVFAANEERFTRRKFESGFPILSLGAALEYVDSPEQIDQVVMDGKRQSPHGSWAKYNILDDPSFLSRIAERDSVSRFFFGTQAGLELATQLMRAITLPTRIKWVRKTRGIGIDRPLKYVDHHTAHAASSALLFPASNGLAVTLDAIGEGYCSRSFVLRNGLLDQINRIPAYHSPGLLYLYVNRLLGFKPGQEGKVTGLAAHGRPDLVVGVLKRFLIYDQSHSSFKNVGLGYGIEALRRLQVALVGFSSEDIAAGVQRHLEDLVLAHVSNLIDQTKLVKPNIYLAGGVFANVSLNRRIADELPVGSVNVAPHMGDGGLGIGAALYVHPQKVDFTTLYLGTPIPDGVIRIPPQFDDQVNSRMVSDIWNDVGQLLAQSKVVAVARGRMEYGPRALGNRSILAAVGDKKINDWLNQRLNRTEFMPFAPMVRDIDCHRYFILTQPLTSYENMTITCFATELGKKECPAVVHLDGTARPQIVTERRNPWIYKLLSRYEVLTGCGVLLNTSFNLHEEPIVNSVENSLDSFLRGGLDALVLGELLVTPKNID